MKFLRYENNSCQYTRRRFIPELMFMMQPIGFVRSPYTDTSQIPRGFGAQHLAEGALEILPEFAQGLTDIEGFSHLFIIWVFNQSQGYELLTKPPTDSHLHGVFATRSPYRPNPLGLTVVELLGREANQLQVRGIDMLDGTPILDLKPYLSSVPAETIKRGWLAQAEARKSL
jgi:tRNA-Thr(GGU) m(6)t(6)A37 methyltransferase TsaA